MTQWCGAPLYLMDKNLHFYSATGIRNFRGNLGLGYEYIITEKGQIFVEPVFG